MKLLTKAILNKLPKLYENDGKNLKDVKVVVKFFCPWNSWKWYATEFDGEDTFYGYVTNSNEKELGYFSLSELKSVNRFGLGIERDMYYGNHTLAEVMEGVSSAK